MKIDARYTAILKLNGPGLPSVEFAIPMYAVCDSDALTGAAIIAERLGMRMCDVLDHDGIPV